MKKTLFTALAVIAMMIVPATSMAAPAKFGSALNPTVQPSNSLPGLDCGEAASGPCTFVQQESEFIFGTNGDDALTFNGSIAVICMKPTAAPTAASSPRRPARSRRSVSSPAAPAASSCRSPR